MKKVFKKISRKKRELLNELMKFDVSKLNMKIANFFKEKLMQELAKQKALEESIKRAKEMFDRVKKIKKVIPVKEPIKEMKKIIPMGGFGF